MANNYAQRRNNYQNAQNAPAPVYQAAPAPTYPPQFPPQQTAPAPQQSAPQPIHEARWTDVQGFVPRLYVNVFNDGRCSYSAQLGNKNDDGTWDNEFVDFNFAHNLPVPKEKGVFALIIKRGFWTFYRAKNGAARPKIVVMDCEWRACENGNH